MPFFTAIGQPVGAVVDGATAGAVVGAADGAAVAGGASGRLRISPEQVDGAIAVFKGALAAVESEVRWAVNDIQARPPANDAVSNDAANAFNRVGYENADSAVAAWEGAVQQLRSIVEQLEAARQTIVSTDTGNVTNFQVP